MSNRWSVSSARQNAAENSYESSPTQNHNLLNTSLKKIVGNFVVVIVNFIIWFWSVNFVQDVAMSQGWTGPVEGKNQCLIGSEVKILRGWTCGSEADCLPGRLRALGSRLSTANQTRREEIHAAWRTRQENHDAV